MERKKERRETSENEMGKAGEGHADTDERLPSIHSVAITRHQGERDREREKRDRKEIDIRGGRRNAHLFVGGFPFDRCRFSTRKKISRTPERIPQLLKHEINQINTWNDRKEIKSKPVLL